MKGLKKIIRQFPRTGNSFFSLILVSLMLCANAAPGADVNFGAEVKKAKLSLQGDYYALSAEMAYQLSKPAKEALINGVPLFWDIQIKVLQQRPFLWKKTLLKKTIRYRIQYHALLNMFRVRNESTGTVDNFSTLSAALDLISVLHNVRIIDKQALDSKRSYQAGIRIVFDREALPLPLRPLAYLTSQWYLSSDWYLWPLTK